jgi:hypothetical protein
MAKLQLDLTNVTMASASKTEHIPAGKYNASIVEVEYVETKNGFAIKPFFMVTSGDQKGKVVAGFLNLCNRASPENERISLSQFKSLLVYSGFDNDPKSINIDTDDLIGRELGITVADKEREYDGKKFVDSDVKKFSPLFDAVVAEAPKPVVQNENNAAPLRAKVEEEKKTKPWLK